MKVEYSPLSLHDILRIFDRISERDLLAGATQVEVIRARIRHLLRHPEMGRAGHAPGTRELIVDATYIVVYERVDDETLRVLRVFHGREDWKNKL